ncbi:MAG TPA: thiamine pyrophosphate-binding protein [Rhodopila sp.]|uniref:thiamine pyrophosphate-binding protein n=1 Tax=Rhodopila sp. TaxID=2480087 RepID=UPI002C35EF0C|nr:thiamine pyrophosphate-binding protein [Rhodopila sp.]HVY17454.1 thiamine pyrophosphate-binding protein [Rhodopila sp.]
MTSVEPVTGAEFLARSLAANGTTHVFFIDAVLRRTLIELGTLGVQRVLGHSEKAVAYMADGYARIARRPGICFAQSVGAANLAAGLQDAYLGRAPVIAMTGHKQPWMQHRNAYQEIPHAPLFAPVTKFAARVDQAEDLPRLMRQAWREAMTGTPRPAHLDLNGLQAEVIETGLVSEPPVADPVMQMTLPPYRPVPSPSEVRKAAEQLLAAKRLVIVAGEGATASDAGRELLMLAQALEAPIATSLGARGIVPTRHRLSVGCAGNYAAPPANQIVHEADLVLFVGCETGDQVTHTWRIPAPETRCVQIDIDPTEIGRSYGNTLGLMGDPKATLAALIQTIGRVGRDSAFADRAAGIVAAWRESRAAALASNAAPIWPDRLCAEITRALPPDGILVADTGYSGIWSSTLIELNGEGQTYLRAAGSLGWSFPAALGAKCAAPNRKVICWSGDGAVYYHLTELETARRRGIAVTLVINNNSGFGQGWPNIQRQQGNKPGDVAELVRFGPTNFADVARTFGLRGIRVEQPDQVAPALREAVASDETVVVDVATDIDCRAPEPWLPEGA